MNARKIKGCKRRVIRERQCGKNRRQECKLSSIVENNHDRIPACVHLHIAYHCTAPLPLSLQKIGGKRPLKFTISMIPLSC
uniref:Uncharacterized protein n=1 Tax=Siphoviridae sp. ctpnN3 TaxID=2825677 RepID=A0A8S5QEE2_9CAUD|nr:MAG TPA: hypothetical protein [Siphoviridae sp. ctpnN3]